MDTVPSQDDDNKMSGNGVTRQMSDFFNESWSNETVLVSCFEPNSHPTLTKGNETRFCTETMTLASLSDKISDILPPPPRAITKEGT